MVSFTIGTKKQKKAHIALQTLMSHGLKLTKISKMDFTEQVALES